MLAVAVEAAASRENETAEAVSSLRSELQQVDSDSTRVEQALAAIDESMQGMCTQHKKIWP